MFRSRAVVCLAVSAALWAAPASAQDAQALKGDLETLRQQFDRVRDEYEKAIKQMSERLQRLEARPPVTSAAPMVVQVPPAPASPAAPTLMELARPRQPFALYDQKGGNRLLFDIGLSADFIGNITQRNVAKANAGSIEGRENRFFHRDVGVDFFGAIDPYARGVIHFEAAEDFNGEEIESVFLMAEAHLTFTALPYGTQVKIGKVLNRFGLFNETHAHDLPWPDGRPNVMRYWFGPELGESGAEVTWVPDLPVYVQALVGVFNGDNEFSFGRSSIKNPLVTGRLRTFLELTDSSAVQFGISGAHGQTDEKLNNVIGAFDLKYKFTPEGWKHSLVTVGGEFLAGARDVEDGRGGTDTLMRNGWYAYGSVQPWKQWVFGARYDSTQYPVNPGREWAVIPWVEYSLTDFTKFRLAYKHTDRTHRDGFNNNGGSARTVDEVFFQLSFFMGAHPSHPF